eukprot:1530528-Amphidinium_carterae.1
MQVLVPGHIPANSCVFTLSRDRAGRHAERAEYVENRLHMVRRQLADERDMLENMDEVTRSTWIRENWRCAHMSAGRFVVDVRVRLRPDIPPGQILNSPYKEWLEHKLKAIRHEVLKGSKQRGQPLNEDETYMSMGVFVYNKMICAEGRIATQQLKRTVKLGRQLEEDQYSFSYLKVVKISRMVVREVSAAIPLTQVCTSAYKNLAASWMEAERERITSFAALLPSRCERSCFQNCPIGDCKSTREVLLPGMLLPQSDHNASYGFVAGLPAGRLSPHYQQRWLHMLASVLILDKGFDIGAMKRCTSTLLTSHSGGQMLQVGIYVFTMLCGQSSLHRSRRLLAQIDHGKMRLLGARYSPTNNYYSNNSKTTQTAM